MEYEPRHGADFVRLNRKWIEDLFWIEPLDEALFSDVDGAVAAGSVILIAEDSGEVVGTCMCTPEGDGAWEVGKLTTDERFRGKGIGTALLKACISEISARGGTRAVIHTNSVLEGAVRMYEKEGFREVPVPRDSEYSRVDLRLELDLTRS